MRRAITDPTVLAAAIGRRLDTVETGLTELGEDVTALGRGVTALTIQIRDLSQTRVQRSLASDTGTGGHGEPGTAPATDQLVGPIDEGEQGQRDWLAVTAPDVAVGWVLEVADWSAQVLDLHGLRLAGTACWPLHPDVVVELLALVAQRHDAYGGAKPAAVSEWLTRWLPAGVERIRAGLKACSEERAHWHDGHLFDPSALDPAHAAAWWATDRATPAPRALALPRLD